MFRSFIKDSIVYAIPTFLSRGLSLLLLPLFTRVLSPEDYGSLDLFTVFANIVSLTVALEISQGVARFYGSDKSPEGKILYSSTAFWFTVICYTAFLVIAFFYSNDLSTLIMGRSEETGAFRIGIVYIWLSGLLYLVQNQFRWELRSINYAIVSILVALSTAGFSLWLAFVKGGGLNGLLWGMSAGALVGVIYGVVELRNSFRFRFCFQRLREMLVFSIPLVPSGIALLVGAYIDRIMINRFLSIEEVGLYGIGFRLASATSLIMAGFQGALTPLIYTFYQEGNTPNQLARIFRFFTAASLAGYALIAIFANDLIQIFATSKYAAASGVVIFLVPATLLAQAYIFAPGIAIKKRTHLLVWINLSVAVINTVLNLLLIPLMGIEGAAMATFIGCSCGFAIQMWISQVWYPVPHNWKQLGAATALIALLVFIVSTLNAGASGSVSIKMAALILSTLVIFYTRLISPTDLRALLNYAKTAFRISV